MGIATATVSSSNVSRQLTNTDPSGTLLGNSITDLIGFYGDTSPAGQASGAAQAAIARGASGASIGTIATSQSPAGALSQTSTEANMTLVTASSVWKIGTNDLLYVNKPTQQGGLGVGNVRVSGTNAAAVSFSNFTTGVITPTAGEKYAVVALKGFPTITQALTPAAVAAFSTTEQQFAVTGLRAGEVVQVSKPTTQAGLDIAGCRVVSANLLGVTFVNITATPVTPTAAEVYTIFSVGGMDAVTNNILVQAAITTGIAVSQNSSELAITATGLAVTDTVLAATKPTFQAGLGVAGTRTSAVNTVGITFSNSTTAALTPTASEVYGLSLYRPAPAAPMVQLSATLTPTSVAANTAVEQGFTVSGLVTNTPVWVNKPSFTPGLGIMGARVTGTNGLALTFTNSTSAAITPPSEAYLIASFGQAIPDVNATWIYTASPVSQQQSLLANAIRSALTNVNLIAGA